MSDVTPEFLAAVSDHTGVPVEFLTGDSTRAVWDSAQAAIDWKNATLPTGANAPVTTAAVSPTSQPTRITPQQLVQGDDWMSAWRAGRLTPLGAPAPPPRRTGESQRNAAP
jgi:hypothetical protein